MKKLLLICLCLLLGYSGFSQTIFQENFQSAWTLPATLVPAWSGTADPSSWHMNSFTTNWPYTTGGAYSPTGANSTTQSARFNTYGIAAGGTSDFISPSLDLSAYAAGAVYLKFYHINPSGTDVINVYVSEDNGTTWSSALSAPLGVDATWAAKSIQLPGNAATTKIKFTGTSDYGNDDMGIDEIRVCKPYTPSATPITFTATSITATGMTVGWTDNSTDEIGFRVYRSSDNVNFVKIGSDVASTTAAGTGTTYSQAQTGLVPGTTYYYRIVAFADFETTNLTGSQATNAALLINSIADGAWSSTATWSTGVIPTSADFVTIQNNVNVDVATAACYKLTINAGKTLSCTGTAGVLTVGSDLTNNGALNLWVSASQLAGLTFIEPNNNTFSGTGTTNLNTLIINKGTSYASVLEMNLPNFTVKGLSSAAVGFLTLTKGMLKVSGTNTFNGAVFTTAAYSIGATVGFWLNNLNFTVNGQNGSPTVAGMLRITQGIYNIGTATGNSMGFSAGSNIIIEGGTVNATGRFGVAAAANTFTYTQSGGTITVCTIGNASTTLYNFDLGTSISSTINWTGGTVVVQKAASGTTHPGYRNDAGGNIAGGTLQIGNAASGAAGIFNIYSTVPNLVIDPTYAHSVIFTLNTSTGQFYDNCQNITIGAGTSLNIGPNLFLFEGTTFTNNGTLIATGASTRLYFSNTVAQTYTGTGVATAPVTSLDFDNDVSVTFSQTNNMACARIDLFAGNVFGSNKLTLGNASAVSNSVQIGGTTTPLSPGSFDAPFTFNLGTLGEIVYYLRSDASRTTGGEINPSRVLTALTYDDNDPAHTLTLAGGNLSAGTLYVTNGLINTSASNLLTVTGGTTTSIVGGSSTAYVNGPLAVTLPASLVTGSTYAFPVGKSAYKPLELVNPITNAGGTVVVKSEVFDSNCGGITGAGIGTLNTNRYWNSAITSGAGNFTGTAVRLTEDGLAANNIMAQSGTVNGTYNLISSLPPASTTIISDNITSLGYFVVGTSIAVVTGTLNGTVTDASSNPISGATVSFGSNTTTTAANGTYEFLNVFHGTYTVTCSKTGYITSTVPGVVINSSSTTTQNFTLSFQLDPPVNLQGSVQNNNDAHLTWNVPGSATLQDGFESYNDFAINFPPWINTDVDGSLTYGITDVDWLNSGSAQSFIVYNSLTTTPPFASNIAHSGDKFAACFAASTPANNDWLISPQVVVVTGSVLKFWARSYVDTYGLERFKVGISTTGTATTDFTIISAGTYVEAPLAWTEYTYDLSAYVGQNIHVAINCVSSDAFILMVDDFSVGVSGKSLSGIDNPTVNPALEQLTNAGNSITRFKDGSISNAQMNNNEMSRSNSKLINHAQSVNTDIPAVNIQDLDSHAALVMNNSHAPARSPWTLSGYNIYREGIKINASLVTDQFYNDLGLAPGTYHFGVKAVYPQGESAAVNTTIVITAPLSKTLNLTSVFLEGLYAGNGTMSTAALHVPPFGAGVADLITVELHAAADYSLVTSYEVELSTTGTATVTVGAAYGASYYITVKHRNSIETTTAVPVSFAGATIDQAFTLGNVYGGNLGLMSGPGTYYAIYAGDVDQNGTVDSGDFTPVDNDASLYLSGYLATDVNGDGGIDTGDFTAVDNNGLNYISTAHP